MKTKLGLFSAIALIAIVVLTIYAFEISRWLPLRIQWLHGSSIASLLFGLFLLLTKVFYHFTRNEILKTHLISGPLVFVAVLAFAAMLYPGAAVKRTADVAKFLEKNELKLKQVVENRSSAQANNQILADLNVRLIRVDKGTYHFELYRFLGYGYRILYTENLEMKKPESPGGSPTFQWHTIKENWYYYSYLD